MPISLLEFPLTWLSYLLSTYLKGPKIKDYVLSLLQDIPLAPDRRPLFGASAHREGSVLFTHIDSGSQAENKRTVLTHFDAAGSQIPER